MLDVRPPRGDIVHPPRTIVVVLALAVVVLPGCTLGSRRIAVTVGQQEAVLTAPDMVELSVPSCNGNPAITVLEQEPDQVRVEVATTVPGRFAGSDDCLDLVQVELDEPLGERPLVDLTTGDPITLGVPEEFPDE